MNQQRPGPVDWAGGFEDVRETERKLRQDFTDRTNNLRAAIALCDGILQIESAGGFKAFVVTLEDMLKHRTNELLSARDGRDAAVLQGRCQELKAILSLMTSTRANRDTLAKALTDTEDRFRELEKTIKPNPTPEQKP